MEQLLPKTNVLLALYNILKSKQTKMPNVIDYKSNNKVNSEGDLLEYYVKDAFCGSSFNEEKTDEKLKEYRKVFSYLGNSSNPPDFVITHGPAVEVKKIQGDKYNSLALNSSFPKDYLYANDPKIKKECSICEDEFGGWKKKDMIYAVGNVEENHLHNLWLVYGDCYCADKSTYEAISTSIKDGVTSISGVEFATTKELGRVNRVDPLGITYLRIRGMWGIEHPSAVFRPFINPDSTKTNIFVLMKSESYEEINEKPNFEEFIEQNILEISNVKIPNPNNPIKEINAILFSAAF